MINPPPPPKPETPHKLELALFIEDNPEIMMDSFTADNLAFEDDFSLNEDDVYEVIQVSFTYIGYTAMKKTTIIPVYFGYHCMYCKNTFNSNIYE